MELFFMTLSPCQLWEGGLWAGFDLTKERLVTFLRVDDTLDR